MENKINEFISYQRENFNKEVLDVTYKAQQKYGFEIGTGKHSTWNNEADAFKHVYMQWYLAHYYGEKVAKFLGDMHENETPNAPQGERNMDLWNNSVGREIARKMKPFFYYTKKNKEEINDIISRIIYKKMRRGELITTPNDKRKFNEKTGEREGIKLNTNEQDVLQSNITNYNLVDYSRYNNELFGGYRPDNGGEVYVREYKRSDGTVVKAHWRSYPGDFDPNKRLTDMQEPELGHALDFWFEEERYA